MTPDDVLDLLGIEISPARLKCALLSLDTLQHALAEGGSATAEGAAHPSGPAEETHVGPGVEAAGGRGGRADGPGDRSRTGGGARRGRRARGPARRPRAARMGCGPHPGRGAHPPRRAPRTRGGGAARPHDAGRRLLRPRDPLPPGGAVHDRRRVRGCREPRGRHRGVARRRPRLGGARRHAADRRADAPVRPAPAHARGGDRGAGEAGRLPRPPRGRGRARLAGRALPRGRRRRDDRDRRLRRRGPLEPPAPGAPHHGPGREGEGRVGAGVDRGAQPVRPRRRRTRRCSGPGNVDELIAGYEVIVDGTDSFETRYALNDAAVRPASPSSTRASTGSRGS